MRRKYSLKNSPACERGGGPFHSSRFLLLPPTSFLVRSFFCAPSRSSFIASFFSPSLCSCLTLSCQLFFTSVSSLLFFPHSPSHLPNLTGFFAFPDSIREHKSSSCLFLSLSLPSSSLFHACPTMPLCSLLLYLTSFTSLNPTPYPCPG